MIRILSNKRYWSLIGRIADDQETIKGQAKVISAQEERIKELLSEIQAKQNCIDYTNDLLTIRRNEIIKLRKFLSENNISFDLDFPPTERIPDSKTDINQILEL